MRDTSTIRVLDVARGTSRNHNKKSVGLWTLNEPPAPAHGHRYRFGQIRSVAVDTSVKGIEDGVNRL